MRGYTVLRKSNVKIKYLMENVEMTHVLLQKTLKRKFCLLGNITMGT